jgi:spermidine/putrescine transport system permease protein
MKHRQRISFLILLLPPTIFLIVFFIPFWTNFLVRTYAWMVLLRAEGVINTFLQNLHLIDRSLQLLFTPLAVGIGLIYGYLPFTILPLYATMERFNFTLIEAAQDLGAND